MFVFTDIRRSCWLTFAALRIDSFLAIQSCDTVVLDQSSLANASFRGSEPFKRTRSAAFRPAARSPWVSHCSA